MRFAHVVVAVAVVLLSAACARPAPAPSAPRPAPEPPITDGRSVVAAMQRKYRGAWYRTLSFTQNNTLRATTGRETKSQWIENVRVPGKLRIDYLPLASKSGVLYDGARIHVFDNGKPLTTTLGVNVYLLLTADAYAQPDSVTARLLTANGFDLTKPARRDTWLGQSAWVVGAAANDSTSTQFWLSTDRLLVLRVVQKETRGPKSVVTEARFAKYQDVGGFPIAHAVELRRDGRLYFTEEYADVKVNGEVEPGTFDPSKWSATQPKP